MKTPKTLREAIKNSLNDYLPEGAREMMAQDMEPHVIDFLSQRFAENFLVFADEPVFISALSKLFFELTGRKVK